MFISRLVGNLKENRDARPIFVLCFSYERDEIKLFCEQLFSQRFMLTAFLSHANCAVRKRNANIILVTF